MRPHLIFIACLVHFPFSQLESYFSEGTLTCCFSFSKERISVNQIESYHITHIECPRHGIIFILKHQMKICADPTQTWVQSLMKLVDARSLNSWSESVISSKVDTKKAESIRTTEPTSLQRPEDTTLVHLKKSNDRFDFDTTQENPNNEMSSESICTRGTTGLQRADESAVVHLKEFAYFCMQPDGE